MTYALIADGKVAKHPYSFHELRADNPDVSFPRDPDDKWLEQWGVFKIAAVPMPEPSSVTKEVVAGAGPELVNGVWTQTWLEVDASADVVAHRQAKAEHLAIFHSVKADAFVRNFIGMTPKQVIAHIDAAPNTVAGMKALITKMALMMLVLARREFK